jgi:hypothetical protein
MSELREAGICYFVQTIAKDPVGGQKSADYKAVFVAFTESHRHCYEFYQLARAEGRNTSGIILPISEDERGTPFRSHICPGVDLADAEYNLDLSILLAVISETEDELPILDLVMEDFL